MNIARLKVIKAINDAQICKKAKEGGFSIHPTTLSNIMKGSSGFGSEKLDAIAYAFDLEPAHMLWSAGFNDDGQPIGIGNTVPLSTVKWAVKKITLGLSYSGIDDLEFKSSSIAIVMKIASELGYEAADLEWQKLLAEYQPKKCD